MSSKRGRPAKEAWRTGATARDELLRGWKGGAAALKIKTVEEREALEAAHLLRAVESARRSLRTAHREMCSAIDVLWERRDSAGWTSYGHEASRLHAEVEDTVPAALKLGGFLYDLKCEAESLYGKVRPWSADRRRNDFGAYCLRVVGEVAPNVAASATAMAYWQLAKYGGDKPRQGLDLRSHAEFKRLVAKWDKAIARTTREARSGPRRRIS